MKKNKEKKEFWDNKSKRFVNPRFGDQEERQNGRRF